MPLLVRDLDDLTPEAANAFKEEMRRHRGGNPTWRVEIRGTLVHFFRVGCEAPLQIKCKREAIGPWSQQSRSKLLRYLNKIDYGRIPSSVFVTLTYPDHVVPETYRERSQHRAVWVRYLEENLQRPVPIVWRIEWEERKSGAYTGKLAPHFHLMVFGVRFIDHENVREWWRKAIKAGEGPLITEVKAIYNEDGACRYLSKYVSKYRSLDISTYHNSGLKFGRHWGILRKELIPLCPVAVERSLDDAEAKIVRQFKAARSKWYDAETGGGYYLLGKEHAKRFAAWLKASCKRKG